MYRRYLLHATKQYKKTMNKFIYKYKVGQQLKLRKMHKHSPKGYWKYLNSINRKKSIKQPSIDDIYEFYKNLNVSDKSDLDIILDESLTRINLEDDDVCLNSPITSAEISKCISKQKKLKGPRP